MSRQLKTTCRTCGAPIRLVMVVPAVPRPGTRRSYVPLDLAFDPDTSPIEASHAVSAGGSVCRALTADNPIAPGETPALTHFATCTAPRMGAAAMTTGGAR